jgi:hypothetical protein
MKFHNPENDPADCQPLEPSAIYDLDQPLTPARSSADSLIVSTDDSSADDAVCTPLVAMAVEILSDARTLSGFYAAHSLRQPSFDLDGPEDYSNDLPDKIHELRARLRAATADMQILAAGPKENIMWMAWGYHDVSILHYVSHFKIAEAVPLHGTIALEEVSKPCSCIL